MTEQQQHNNDLFDCIMSPLHLNYLWTWSIISVSVAFSTVPRKKEILNKCVLTEENQKAQLAFAVKLLLTRLDTGKQHP